MEQKEIKINCPEGFVIDKENSTFECIKFKPIKKELPKTWEGFCMTHSIREGECWINNLSEIEISEDRARRCFNDRNLLPNKKYAEAMLALCQLIQLRDCYNDGWIPDWTSDTPKYTIKTAQNKICRSIDYTISKILVFKTAELHDQFFENFKDLIEVAKPLL